MRTIAARYAAHRKIIDDIVKQATDLNAATEAEATEWDSMFTLLLWSVSVLVLLISAPAVGVDVRRHSRRCVQMTKR